MRTLLISQLTALVAATSIKRFAMLLAVIAITCVAAPTAHAVTTYSHTWVSGTGTSNSQCSVTSPCQTFAQAIAVTASGGEIDCLDPGDFGPVTITISVTIDCEGASNGGITYTTDTNAITINGANIVVNLIGLELNGSGNSTGYGGVGIDQAGYVNIRNCKIYGFAGGQGIYFQSGTLVADNVFVANNGAGIYEQSWSGAINMSVRNSNINNNNGYGILVNVTFGTHAGATIEQTTLAFNTESGLYVIGPGAVAVIGGSTVVNNNVGVDNAATLFSFKNNQIGGNGTDISGTITPYPRGPLN